jgi:tetratricopeptide (TPR) repeat protein
MHNIYEIRHPSLKTLAVLCIFLAFLCSTAFAESADDNITGIKIRELSAHDSMTKIIDQNKVLKAENEELLSTISRLESSQLMLNNRIRGLTANLDALNRDAQLQRHEFDKEIEAYKLQIENFELEKKELETQKDDLNKKLSDKKHYSNWKNSLKELNKANKELLRLGVEKERLIVENAKMHYNLGVLFFNNGDYKMAAYEFETALKYMPNDFDTHYNLAILYDYHIKDSRRAKEHYRKYLSLAGDSDANSHIKERFADNALRSRLRD